MTKILIVEDEESISDLLKMTLEIVEYKVYQVYDGKAAIEFAYNQKPDLILLDVMIPHYDGFEVLSRIKQLQIPTIFLTAREELKDCVNALRSGADDYIVKPFKTTELLARIEAVLRRYNNKSNEKKITVKNINIYPSNRIVKKGEEIINLTPKEFDLLLFLVKNSKITFTREQILEKVWEIDYAGETRTVDIHIQKLRMKLGLENEIQTVYRIGYRFLENIE